ncbi:hypothetical protein O6H91_05G098300 [Diphasiastrum complanatum]|uniref:Uncharacterized protein n=1 Tax=Diphasiastrum complanatum TaxID=34168 RepID=A0ACC2DRA3_DIPCM|nr:hypothetical protein O6H91_05G098300 [Diphasiastrum complanatum]
MDYYYSKHKHSIRFGKLPCLDVGRKNAPIYLPPELCRIVEGQRFRRKLSKGQRTKLLKESEGPPKERKHLLKSAMIKNNYHGDHLLQAFNTGIDPNMTEIKGRCLDAPRLAFQNMEHQPTFGSWSFRGQKLLRGAQITFWAVTNFCDHVNVPLAKDLTEQIRKFCNDKGMDINADYWVFKEAADMTMCSVDVRVQAMFKTMRSKSVQNSPPEFILCLLPQKNSELYAPFKRYCGTRCLIPSQCIVLYQNPHFTETYLTSLVVQLNAKMGGCHACSVMPLPKVQGIPSIIFGMEISQGSVSDPIIPSIAAVVASTDSLFMRYITRARAQPPRKETIDGLHTNDGGMIVELMRSFYRINNGRKPEQVVIYRGGVGDDEFVTVLNEELSAFRQAFAELSENYQPKVTYLVVQRRHHTRFFPVNGEGNVPPGTIVDTEVCHPTDYDFFLCSHTSRFGTARPAHYYVLHDENGFLPDELQRLTHSLCYLQARCPNSISTATPTYYAHLVAEHLRKLMIPKASPEAPQASTSAGASSSSRNPLLDSITTSELQYQFELPYLNQKIFDSMFFC